jgi:hypothetical protein
LISEVEIVARRRKWTAEDKVALLAEVETEGAPVVAHHGISNSLIHIGAHRRIMAQALGAERIASANGPMLVE